MRSPRPGSRSKAGRKKRYGSLASVFSCLDSAAGSLQCQGATAAPARSFIRVPELLRWIHGPAKAVFKKREKGG
jgi:hypothetical protein